MTRAGAARTAASRESRGERPRLCRSNGQHTFEYAGALAVMAAALIGMAVYLKRGISGKLRDVADAAGGQYAPRATTSDLALTVKGTTTTTSTLKRDQDVDIGGKKVKASVMKHETTTDEATNRTGTEHVGPMGGSAWE